VSSPSRRAARHATDTSLITRWRPAPRLQPLRQPLQRGVAQRASLLVAEAFEVVDIDQGQDQGPPPLA
jgi:hypothetical protein